MNILITDIELYLVCGMESQKELKSHIKSCITSYSTDVGLDITTIRNIIIDDLEQSTARVDVSENNPNIFDIFIQKYLIWYLYDKKQGKNIKAETIIKHELFHCIDMLNTSKNIDRNIVDNPIKTYGDLCLHVGYCQWSEYFAHYNSSKISRSEILALRTDGQDLMTMININRKQGMFDTNPPNFKLLNSSIKPFINKIVILIANINSNNNINFTEELNKYKMLDNSINEYISKVNTAFQLLYNQYPHSLTYVNLRILGKFLIEV